VVQDERSDGAHEVDQVDRAEDVPAAKPVAGEEAGIPGQVRSADLVADVSLAQGVTYTPGELKVLRTGYVFRVNDVVQGEVQGQYITVNDTGGAYPDGSTVSTERSFRLVPGGRYLVFAFRVGGDLWLRQVLQVHDEGAVVADASGKVLVGFQEGVPLAEAEPSFEPLRYVRPVARPATPMEGPPDEASEPLPDHQGPAVAVTEGHAPIGLGAVVDYLRAARRQASAPPDVVPGSGGDGSSRAAGSPVREPPGNIEGRSQESAPGSTTAGTTEAVLSGNYVTAFQSHFHFMPNDDNWSWASHCRGSWNALVDNRLGLFSYKITTSDGQPIRNRLPVANNGQHNIGVLSNAQMTAGGYDTWDVLSANGVCYTWTSSNRVTETDILINPAIAGDEAQFRKTLTHEYGHALTLGHESARLALMYPGTFRQPPNLTSLWYSRRDDHHGVRSMLDWVNANVGGGSWAVARFSDMATWSQAHASPGTTGNLVMTRLVPETIARGSTAAVQFFHMENRGNLPAQNVRVRFFLSTNDIISAIDHEVASFTWTTFSSWWSGSLTVRIPDSVPPGQYFLGWIVTTDTAERSSSNNQAILLRDHSSGFARVRVTVT